MLKVDSTFNFCDIPFKILLIETYKSVKQYQIEKTNK